MADFRLPQLEDTLPVTKENGRPTLLFQRWWQTVVKQLELAINRDGTVKTDKVKTTSMQDNAATVPWLVTGSTVVVLAAATKTELLSINITKEIDESYLEVHAQVEMYGTDAVQLDIIYEVMQGATVIADRTFRLKVDGTWTVVYASSGDIPNGIFTIASARPAIGKAPYECQADVIGIPVTNAPDIIVDMYERFEAQSFNSTFYDTATWTANKAGVPTCGLVIDNQTAILDIIPVIQNGVYPTFRFDMVVGDTRKTIRLDDKTRPVDWYVSSLDILNIDDLKPKDVSDYLFGEVVIEYDQDHTEDQYRKITVDTYKQDVIENYQWSNSTTIPTLLTNSTNAQDMADAKAFEFSVPIRTIDLVLMGQRYFGVEIFDIMQIDTAMGRDEYYIGDFGGREFLGVIKVQVIGIQPDYSSLTVSFTCKILETIVNDYVHDFLSTENGFYIITEDESLIGV